MKFICTEAGPKPCILRLTLKTMLILSIKFSLKQALLVGLITKQCHKMALDHCVCVCVYDNISVLIRVTYHFRHMICVQHKGTPSRPSFTKLFWYVPSRLFSVKSFVCIYIALKVIECIIFHIWIVTLNSLAVPFSWDNCVNTCRDGIYACIYLQLV